MNISSAGIEKANRIYFRINRDLQNRRFEHAKVQTERLEAIEGKTARIYDLKGMFAASGGRYADAEKFHKTAAEMSPDTVRFTLNLGNLYMITGEWEKASAAFGRILDKNPSYFPALNNLAMTLFRLGKEDSVLPYIERMKAVNPSAPASYRLESLYYFEKGDMEKALAAADRNITLDSRNPLTFIMMGRIFAEMKRYDDAVEAFEMASSMNPNDTDTKVSLAIAYSNIDKFNLALPLLEEAVLKVPSNGLAHKGLAIIYNFFGRYELSEKHAVIAREYGQVIEGLSA